MDLALFWQTPVHGTLLVPGNIVSKFVIEEYSSFLLALEGHQEIFAHSETFQNDVMD